jgi:hypothetical protein
MLQKFSAASYHLLVVDLLHLHATYLSACWRTFVALSRVSLSLSCKEVCSC